MGITGRLQVGLQTALMDVGRMMGDARTVAQKGAGRAGRLSATSFKPNRRYRKADLLGLIGRVKSGEIVGFDKFRDAVAQLKPF